MAANETSFWRRLLNGWMAIAGRFGFVQTMLILVLFYAILLGPAWAVSSIGRRDYLTKRGLRSGGSAWIATEAEEPDLERAKTQS